MSRVREVRVVLVIVALAAMLAGVAAAAVAPKAAASKAAPAARAGGAAEWPYWLGPTRDAKSPDTGLLKEWPEGGPTLLWKVSDIGTGFSSVAVSGGTVYITGDVGDKLVLFAFDADGKPRWEAPIDKAWTDDPGGARSSPVVDGGKVYLLSGHGLLACVDAKTGRPVWGKNLREFGGEPGGWGYAESVLILGNLAIAKPGGSKGIVALNKTTGAPGWASQGFSAGPEYGSCLPFTFAKMPLIVTGTNKGIVCVSAANGALAWSNDFSANNTANCPTPAYADGYVFWANGYGKGGICMKLAASGGRLAAQEAWRTRDMDCHHGGYVIHEGYIYGNNGGGWACLDLKTGKRQWEEKAVGKGSLCWADGMLYLFGENGGRAALATCSPSGLEVKGKVTIEGSGPSWAHPVVIGGRLYLRYAQNLYCFDVKAK
ncbi:MAG: PQQ-like beta-propeller repeat protein [Planctomycetes bacterium]|nr:PQQ-like beta-propeller repeat protein [Planctomycetota bacterium]